MSAFPPLPRFRYHPDPLATGSLVPSAMSCRCCGRNRGYLYALAPYAGEQLDEQTICPWCIASGEANRKLGAEFVDIEAVPDEAPESAMHELVERTPGYAAWQSEQWRACCGDAAAFLGPFGRQEILQSAARGLGTGLEAQLLDYLRDELDYPQSRAARLVLSLSRDRGPTAYVFQCLTCRRLLFHVDFP